ncbi:MAG: LUD domain-containing protein [Thermoleophilia bacterium]
MRRAAFLERIRAQLRRSGDPPVPPAPHPSPEARSRAAADAPVARFRERLKELEVTLFPVASREAARRSVGALVEERGWATTCAPASLRWPGLPGAWVDESREAQFGLAEARWALAETGTVVLDNRGEAARGHSLLPAASGFLVAESRILPRLGDALRRLAAAPDDLPACVSFVSGPSNTADISGVRCVGVHGPAEVFVWLIAGE